MKIKTGDNVRILAGKDKGKEGKVLQVFPELNRIVIEGINLRKRHLRAAGRPGQIVEFPAPLHVSNVQLVSGKTSGRVGFTTIGEGADAKKVRVIRKAGKEEQVD